LAAFLTWNNWVLLGVGPPAEKAYAPKLEMTARALGLIAPPQPAKVAKPAGVGVRAPVE